MLGLLQDLFMAPSHALEGAAAKWGFSGPLYRGFGKVYRFSRRFLLFGEKQMSARVKPGNRLLDLGCGPGYLTGMLEGRFDVSVGLDLTPAMMQKARSFAPRTLFVRGDMTRPPFAPGSFDCVVSLGAVHCVDYSKLADAVFEVLAPGGEFHVLIEDKIIPLFAPRTSGASLMAAFRARGFEDITQTPIGRLYSYIRARKK